MGTYVKGMETPTWCGGCDFLSGLIMPDDEYHCYAPTSNKNNSINVTDNVENWSRPEWCPLVEVPEPHGRLIDVNDAKSRMIPLSFSVQKWIGEVELSNCKTVIEAEGR